MHFCFALVAFFFHVFQGVLMSIIFLNSKCLRLLFSYRCKIKFSAYWNIFILHVILVAVLSTSVMYPSREAILSKLFYQKNIEIFIMDYHEVYYKLKHHLNADLQEFWSMVISLSEGCMLQYAKNRFQYSLRNMGEQNELLLYFGSMLWQ